MPIQTRPLNEEICAKYADGVVEVMGMKKFYDYAEKVLPHPEKDELVRYGVSSWDYLAEIKPSALTFIPEMGYAMHSSAESSRATSLHMRQFKLRQDADDKYLATVLLEEWEKVKADLDPNSPLYRAVAAGWVLPNRDTLSEGGMPVSRYPTRDLLFNPQYDRVMTEADLFKACMVDGGFFYQLYSYQFVRLLRASRQTEAVRAATVRVEQAFQAAHAELARHIDFAAFRIMDCDTLAKAQLGSGLIVLNSLLAGRGARPVSVAH
jgi:hypothetical protein